MLNSTRVTLNSLVIGVALLALAGCDAKEREALKGEVASLQVELSAASEARAGSEAQLTQVLDELASVTQGLGPAKISHLDRDNVVVVQANVSGRSLGAAARWAEQRHPPTDRSPRRHRPRAA